MPSVRGRSDNEANARVAPYVSDYKKVLELDPSHVAARRALMVSIIISPLG